MPVTLALLALLGAGAILVSSARSRSSPGLATTRQNPDEGRRRLPTGLLAGLVLVAGLIELYGLRVSLKGYAESAPPAFHVAILVALLTFFFLLSYFLYLWSSHRFRARRPINRSED